MKTSEFVIDYRPDIDGLRGLAVLSVMLFHAFPSLFPGGFIGVDIFFVISGFLITKIIKARMDQNNFDFLEFYSRRIRRLFPSLILLMTGCFVAGWFLFNVGDFKLLGKHMASSAGFVSNFIFLRESGYFDQVAITKPLLHLWSLSVEEQFYFLWPLFIFIFSKNVLRMVKIIFAIICGSFLLSLYFSFNDGAYAYYFPLSRFWELGVGASLNYLPAAFINREKKFFSSEVVSLFSLFGLILSFIIIDSASAFPGWLALLPVFSVAAIIVVGQQATFVTQLLTHRALVWLGLVSYPLYLIHWPIFSFWKIITLETPSNLVACLVLLVSLALASLIYIGVELPVRKKRGWITTSALLVLMFILGMLGLNMFKRDGYPFRPIAEASHLSNINKYAEELPNAVCHSNFCFPEEITQEKPTVFFWGDSVTANVTYGMTKDDITDLRIQPIVSMWGACPPIDGYTAKIESYIECEEFQSEGFAIIEKYKPKVVFLFANWHGYLKSNEYSRLNLSDLVRTVHQIKVLGAGKVIVIGQFPLFEASQADIGRRVFSRGKAPYTKWLLNEEIFEVDEAIRKFTQENNVEFLSPIDFLCNDRGCQISASTEEYIPMAYDTLHMTPRGAHILFRRAFTKDFF